MSAVDSLSKVSRGGYARWIGLGVASVLVAFVFGDQLSDVVARGRSRTEFGYIFLVPLVAVYLVLLRVSRLKSERTTRGAWIGAVIVLASFICSWIGHDRDILILWQAAPVVALLGLLVSVLGSTRSSALMPAFLILFASLPVPKTARLWVAEPLQNLATSVTAFVLEFSGFSAVREGYVLEINGVPVGVGEACNGMRLVMPLAVVMYAFVFSLPLKPITRLILIAMSLPVALLCNIIRLVPTALAYGYLPQRAESLHDLLGWLMIPLAIAMMTGILRMLEWLDLPVARFRLATS